MVVADQTAERRSIEEVVRTLLAMADSGEGNRSLREKLFLLGTKLASGQLHLAVLGQMKRGKSSFINALLGSEVLPTGVLPVTAIITEIKYGAVSEATIVYATGGLRQPVELDSLADYITESGNPGNQKQVATVQVTYPSPFLEGGIVLIDTPGIGSTHTHNTQITESYLEHVDAGIIFLSIDPPITEVESQFIRRIKEDVPKLFFILNKTDIASAEEVDAIRCFLEKELERLQIESAEIFALSAREALRRNGHAPTVATPSGTGGFEERLRNFLSDEKQQVLVRSVALDALQIARTLKFAACIADRAGAMSADELLCKRHAVDRLLEQTETEMRELEVLLRQRSADILARVEQDLKKQVETSVSEIRRRLRQFQMEHPKETGRAFGALLEEFLMQEVRKAFQNWRIQEDVKLQMQLDALSSRFIRQANGILGCLEQSAGSLFAISVEHIAISCPLRAESRLHYRVERVFYSLDTFLLFLPRFLLRPVVFRRIHNNVPVLLDMNAGRIHYDYLERLQSSMTRFEKELLAAITVVTDSLKAALHAPQDLAKQQA